MQTISANRLVRPKLKQTARCSRGKKESKQLCPIGTPADGFLKQQFLPLFEQGKIQPNQLEIEKEFFKSFSILSKVHALEKANLDDKPYPYNILLAKDSVQKQLKKSAQDIELSVVQDDNGIVKLQTKHS